MPSSKPPRASGSSDEKPVTRRAEKLRGKLSAKSPEAALDVERELLELFDKVREEPPIEPGEPKLESVVADEEEEAVGKFRRNNVAVEYDTVYEPWKTSRSDQPYRDMLAQVQQVRVVGECWGMSRLTHPVQGGGLLYTDVGARDEGHRVEWANDEHDAVRCHVGSTFADVFTFLRGTGKCLANQPGFDGLTVAGVVGTGGHGSGLRLGSIASLVRRMVVGRLDGEGAAIEYARGVNDDELDLAVTHLGRLGPVLSIDLDVRAAFKIEETRLIRRVPRDGIAALIAEAVRDQGREEVHSVEIWVAPYADDDGNLTVAYGKRRFTDAPISDAERPAALRCKALQTLGRVFANLIAALQKSWIRFVLRKTVEMTETSIPVVMEASDGLDFGAPNNNPMISMEMAVPLSEGPKAVEVLLDALEARAAADDAYVYSPIGLRFVGRGPSGLSPQSGHDAGTLHLEVPTFKGKRFGGAEVLGEIQRELAGKLDARPHWGQRVELDSAQLAKLWPSGTRHALRDLVAKVDPHRTFASPLIDDMLALP